MRMMQRSWQHHTWGCQIHYFRYVVWVARISSVFPTDGSPRFTALATKFVNCEIAGFVEIVSEILNKWSLPNGSIGIFTKIEPS